MHTNNNTPTSTSQKALSMYLSTMLLCSSLLLTGCGQSPDTDATPEDVNAATKKEPDR